jgi:geranylgeranyl diphosphate synthase type II
MHGLVPSEFFRPPHPLHSARNELRQLGTIVERRLEALIAPGTVANALEDALSYSLLSPGKRLRPLLTILAAWELGPRDLRALDAGCALEMVHAASLILDDVPAMDNARLRRGRPAAHVRFGEDVALLAVVSLLSRAFAVLGEAPGLTADTRAELVVILSRAIGAKGLARGQLFDLRGTGAGEGEDGSEVNHLKTGVLFVAAVEMAGAILALRDERLTRLHRCAIHLGQAFQLMDDLTDEVEDGPPAGGFVGRDGRVREVAMRGARTKRKDARQLLQRHLNSALGELDPAGHLAGLVRGTFSDVLRRPE